MSGYLYLLLVALLHITSFKADEAGDKEPLGTTASGQQTMSFSSPNLSEEEQHSSFVPDGMKCDACSAVAYQLKIALDKEENKRGGKKLKESDYLDLFEKVCDAKTFDSYGVKNVQGTNRISGKGLEADSVPGMLMGGGKWPNRMSTKCFSFIDELGEDVIYDRYRNTRNLKEYLCRQVTKDCIDRTKNEL